MSFFCAPTQAIKTTEKLAAHVGGSGEHARVVSDHDKSIRSAFHVFSAAQLLRDVRVVELDDVRRNVKSLDEIDLELKMRQEQEFEQTDLVQLFDRDQRGAFLEAATLEGGALAEVLPRWLLRGHRCKDGALCTQTWSFDGNFAAWMRVCVYCLWRRCLKGKPHCRLGGKVRFRGVPFILTCHKH
jgi:hypothetical protein